MRVKRKSKVGTPAWRRSISEALKMSWVRRKAEKASVKARVVRKPELKPKARKRQRRKEQDILVIID